MTMEIQQVATYPVSFERIMREPMFSVGLDQARRGQPFDWRIGATTNDAWEYERGRLFGFIAPLDMPLFIGDKLNPKAVSLCKAAFNRGLVT
jgi:hypothetical protein